VFDIAPSFVAISLLNKGCNKDLALLDTSAYLRFSINPVFTTGLDLPLVVPMLF
jgi:hypothetical protein